MMSAYFRRRRWEYVSQANAVVRAYAEALERGQKKQRDVAPAEAMMMLGGLFEGS
jgi:hypothetical protein